MKVRFENLLLGKEIDNQRDRPEEWPESES
jgi:hypothetical protein